MAEERYALLVNLGRKITDYSVDKDVGGDGMIDLLSAEYFSDVK